MLSRQTHCVVVIRRCEAKVAVLDVVDVRDESRTSNSVRRFPLIGSTVALWLDVESGNGLPCERPEQDHRNRDNPRVSFPDPLVGVRKVLRGRMTAVETDLDPLVTTRPGDRPGNCPSNPQSVVSGRSGRSFSENSTAGIDRGCTYSSSSGNDRATALSELTERTPAISLLWRSLSAPCVEWVPLSTTRFYMISY